MLNPEDVMLLACRKLVFHLVQHPAEIPKQVRDDKKSVLFKDDECFYYSIFEIEAQAR